MSAYIEKDLPSLPERPLPTTPENEAGPSRLPRPVTIAVYDPPAPSASSVTFALPPPTPRLGSLDVPAPALNVSTSVRRTRSFLTPTSPSTPSLGTDEFGATVPAVNKRRLSLFGGSTATVDAKGKGKEKPPQPQHDKPMDNADEKSLTRKCVSLPFNYYPRFL